MTRVDYAGVAMVRHKSGSIVMCQRRWWTTRSSVYRRPFK
jgi:hypothetical protein